MFNFFYIYVGETKDETKISENKKLQQTWNVISNPEKANSGVKRHIVTYEENDTLPKGQTPYRPLPSRINNGFNFPIQLGKIEKKDEVTVYLIVTTNAKVTGVSINGVALQQTEDVSGIYVNNPFPNTIVVAFSGKGGKMAGGQSNIVINTNGGLILNYLEVKVN